VAGHFFLHSAWAKASLVVVMVPLAIIDNGIRIVGLSLLANYVDKSFLLDGRLHDLGGYLTFVLSITVLIVCIALFWRIEQRYGLYAGGRAEVRSNITTAHEPV
jgi:exosortase/archaeosortase family protein